MQLPGLMVLEINVTEEDVPELMTSLIHIAPNTRFMAGHGPDSRIRTESTFIPTIKSEAPGSKPQGVN
jgi:hypothetical protein